MKKIVIIAAAALVCVGLAVTAILFFAARGEKTDYSRLTKVRFLSSGTMLPVRREYSLTLENGKWILRYSNEYDFEESTVAEKEVSPEFAQSIGKILAENKAEKWDGFSKSNTMVMDGDRFEFEMQFSDGRSVRAGGYEAYPKNYGKVISEIRALCDGVLAE